MQKETYPTLENLLADRNSASLSRREIEKIITNDFSYQEYLDIRAATRDKKVDHVLKLIQKKWQRKTKRAK